MSNEMLSPLIGSALRVEDKEQLDEFLSRPDATHVVRSASFEEVFFTIKHVGLAERHVRPEALHGVDCGIYPGRSRRNHEGDFGNRRYGDGPVPERSHPCLR